MPPLSQSDARSLIAEVEEFIRAIGRRPPRTIELGKRAYNLARQYAESPESRTMQSILATARQSWSTTTASLQQIQREQDLPPSHEPSSRKRFKANQAYQESVYMAVSAMPGMRRPAAVLKRPAAVLQRPASLKGVRGRPKNPTEGIDLGNVEWPGRVGSVQLAPQEVVDFLYRALHDFSSFMMDLSPQWFVTWGTLLGAHRGQGLIPYDVDVDVAMVVDSREFTEVWFPKIAAHFESMGYRVHPVPSGPAASAGGRPTLRGCKLAPRRAQCGHKDLYRELLSRRREEANAAGECLSRPACMKEVSHTLSKASEADKRRWASKAIGHVVLDIEVCTISEGQVRLFGVQFPSQAVSASSTAKAGSLQTSLLNFGPLRVPAPTEVAVALSAFFPKGYSKRMYKSTTGQLLPVPARVPQRALPSPGAIDV